MASAMMNKYSINVGLQHQYCSEFRLGNFPPVTTKAKASPFMSKRLAIRSNNDRPSLPEFQIDEYMATKARRVNKALLAEAAVPLILQYPTLLHDHGRERVFATLCIASCELVGGSESSVMPLACAAEMLMTMGINSSLLCHAVEHMATKTNIASPYRLVKAIGEMSSAVGTRGVLAGRIMDIKSKGREVSLSELEIIQRLKRGRLIEASVVSGALIGGGNEEEIDKLSSYGKCVGLAYQVWDDILDHGKRRVAAGDDDNKATYPKLLGVDGAKKYAKELVAEANQELAGFDPTRSAPLSHIANYVVSRQN